MNTESLQISPVIKDYLLSRGYSENFTVSSIAGAGSGEFSLSWAEALREIDIPVVIASRTHHGVVTLNERLAPGCICAGTLPPQKAAVLLRLALTVTHKNAVIQKFFV